MQITRVEATPKSGEGLRDVRGDVVRRRMKADHNIDFTDVRSIVGFLINSDINSASISERSDDLFADPIIEYSTTNQTFLQSNEIFDKTPDIVISVGFKPGVTDNPGKAALDGFMTIFPDASSDSDISTYISYAFYGLDGQATPEWFYMISWSDDKYNADNTKGWEATKSNDTLDPKTIYNWNGSAWVSE